MLKRSILLSRCLSRLIRSSLLLQPRKTIQYSTTSTRLPLPDTAKTLEKFHFNKYTHSVDTVNKNLQSILSDSTTVTLNGWIEGTPRKISKKLVFSHFRDFNSNITQIVTKSEEISQLLRSLKPEDPISVTGTIALKRQSTSDTSNTKEWELIATSIQLVNPTTNSKTSQLDSLKDTPSQYPPEYRYLQLRHPFYQKSMKQRAKAASIVRKTLSSPPYNLTEIETPVLFKSTPEGAKEFLVPTRTKGQFYALPQSPQQYKQLLMASGFKGYFQIAKCFRDEDLRADRQPEFTQVDMEISWSDGEDVRHVVKNLVTDVWSGVRGLPLYTLADDGSLVEADKDGQFLLLDYKEALKRFGIDKPDLRSSLEFVDVTEYFKGTLNGKDNEFSVIEACVLKNVLNSKDKLPDGLFDTNEYKARKPYIMKIKNEDDLNSWIEKLPVEATIYISEINNKLNLSVGDIVAVSDRALQSYENPTPLGRFRQLAIQHFPTSWRREIAPSSMQQPNLDDVFVASWVVNFPLFSPIEIDEPSEGPNSKQQYPIYDYTKFESTHHPFTMAKLEDYEYLASNPLRVHGDHYDLVVNGVELGGGSRRIHDSALQNYIFKEILQIEEPIRLFGHLLTAFEMGCPPHAGLAIGFDRMCAMLLGSNSIRDVVAFPKNQAGVDPVVESPSGVTEKALKLYNIEVRNWQQSIVYTL